MRLRNTSRLQESNLDLALRARSGFPIIRWICFCSFVLQGCGPEFDRLPKLKLA